MIPLDESNSIGQSLLLRFDIIATVLKLIREAWEQVCHKGEINTQSDEDTIAGALHNEMWAAKERLGISGPPQIVNEAATRLSDKSLKPDGFIDFQMVYGWGNQDYFGIECKRVSSKSKDQLTTKYVTQGVMRFITGKYSVGHDSAAMLGFVIDDNLNDCISLICSQLRKYGEKTCMEQDWVDESDFGLQKDLYRTYHRQQGQSFAMRLLHLFLVVS